MCLDFFGDYVELVCSERVIMDAGSMRRHDCVHRRRSKGVRRSNVFFERKGPVAGRGWRVASSSLRHRTPEVDQPMLKLLSELIVTKECICKGRNAVEESLSP